MKARHPIPASDELFLTFYIVFKLDYATHPDSDYVVTCPDLPGFEGRGWTPQAARASARGNIIEYLDHREDAGDPGAVAALHEGGKMAKRVSEVEYPGFATCLRRGEAFLAKTMHPTSWGELAL
jgi:predicted RNase H-like HicB family nuclease